MIRFWLLVALCLSLCSPATHAQTRVINGGRVQVGANDVSAIVQTTVTLTDAQTKALPTTAATLVAAPGAGLVLEPILFVIYAKTTGGAYTNIDANAFMSSAVMGDLPNDSAITTGSATRVSDLLGTTTPHSARLLPYVDTEGVDKLGAIGYVSDTAGLVNVALTLTLNNGSSGNLTGGNAANVLQVLVIYRVISTTSPLTVTCPANIATTSSDGAAVAVTYAAPTLSGGVGPTGSYDLASGSPFDPGATSNTTRVTYTASSTDGQSAVCSFTVTVTNISVAGPTAGAYYVSRSGSDLFSCAQSKTALTAKQTINSALPCLAAGDTLYVRAGTYPENITSVASGTSWSNKVRVAAYPGETVWLTPTSASPGSNIIWLDCACSYIEFDGLNLDGGPSVQAGMWVSTNNGRNPHHIRIQNAEIIGGAVGSGGLVLFGAHTTIGATGSNEALHLTIHGGGIAGGCGFPCAEYGVYLAGPNNLVDGCTIYDTSGIGVQIYNGGGDSPDTNIVRNTTIRDITRAGDVNEVWGIVIAGGSGNQLFNNLIYGIAVGATIAGNAGITVGSGAAGSKLWNNTIYSNTNSGVFVDASATATVVQNNIIDLSGGTNYVNNAGGSTTHDHNLEGTTPVFVNAGAFDFHLQTSSPAKDTGVTLAGVPTDKDGIARPQGAAYNIGAYEFH